MGDRYNREERIEIFLMTLKNYGEVLDDEIKTIEDRILERDWGVKA